MPLAQPSLITRATALFAVALVLALTVLAASPSLHAWLHGHSESAAPAEHEHEHEHEHGAPVGSDDHVCAVTLFAHGVEALLVFFLLVLVRPLVRSTVWRARDWLVAAYPRYWLVPSHAPPLV